MQEELNKFLKNVEIFKNHKLTKNSAEIIFNFLRHGVWLPDEWKCSAGDWFVWDNHSLSGLSMARFQDRKMNSEILYSYVDSYVQFLCLINQKNY